MLSRLALIFACAAAFLPRGFGRNAAPAETAGVAGEQQQAAPAPAAVFSLLSYNILYDSPKWGPEYAWAKRRTSVLTLLRRHAPDLIGLQEVAMSQLASFREALPEYGLTGDVPGRAADERYPWLMNPIFFRLDRFQLLETGVLWLGAVDAQGRPQPGWPAENLPAVRLNYAPWVKLHDLASDRVFYYINAHLPPEGPALRLKSARLLTELAHRFTPGIPVCLAGDCNATEEPAIEALRHAGLRDARTASLTPAQGPASTKVNRRTQQLAPAAVIDHLFVDAGFRVETFAILDDRLDGRFPSDHLPICATLQLR
jgi:endonuclease/exonuclease/phosphatase family metal-dependent hydrolase